MSYLGRLEDPRLSEDPWADDDLNRKRSGQILSTLIQGLEQSYVIAVKGDWGSGKSTFLRRLAKHLERELTPVVFIDAWRTDYADDPLVPFALAIDERVAAKRSARKDKAGVDLIPSLAEFAVKLSVPLATVAAAAAGTAATGAIAAAGLLAKLGDLLLKRQKERGEALDSFRTGLMDAQAYLTGQDSAGKPRQLVVIIDELDRCRPNYAIAVLERIKHYFDVPNIVFLIATDGGNLPAAVQTVYGAGTEGERYLRKFFDFEYELPAPSNKAFSSILFTQFGLRELFKASDQDITDARAAYDDPIRYESVLKRSPGLLTALECLDALAEIAERTGKITLRDQAQIFNALSCHVRTSNPQQCLSPRVLALAECSRYLDRKTYDALKQGELQEIGQFSETLGLLARDTAIIRSDASVLLEMQQHGDVKAYLRTILDMSPSTSPARFSAHRLFARLNYQEARPAQWLKSALWLTSAFQTPLRDAIPITDLGGLTYESLRTPAP